MHSLLLVKHNVWNDEYYELYNERASVNLMNIDEYENCIFAFCSMKNDAIIETVKPLVER